jgi:Zn-dependent protease
MEFVIGIAIVIFSIILHEVAHGYVANALGDPTARLAGRLTLNPLPHIDPVGSILIPGILALTHSPFLIGWAKPVPYNPYQVRGGRWGEAAVAAAGPATNLIIAAFFSLLIRFNLVTDQTTLNVIALVIIANLSLAILNLIPIPPIDGSKVLRALLPGVIGNLYSDLERLTYRIGPFGLILVLIIVINFFQAPMGAAVGALFTLFTGISI